MKRFKNWLSGLSSLRQVALITALAIVIFTGAGFITALNRPEPPTRVGLDQIEQVIADGDADKAQIIDGSGAIIIDLADEASLQADIDKLADEQNSDASKIETNYPRAYAETLTTQLLDADVPVTTEPIPTSEPILYRMIALVPAILIIGFLIWMLKSGALSGGIAKMGKRGEALGERPKVRFADVAGNDEAVEQMRESVDVLRHPEDYTAMNAEAPRAVLMYGPAGTGKTLLAKAVAGEADVPFFAVEGSSFVETFVGVGARRVRDIFDKARKAATEEEAGGAIIFIDEIDAAGRARGATLHPGESESENTLNQLLAEIEGFHDTNVLVIATTNRSDVLDPALLSRFDERISVGLPDRKGREAILGVHTRNKPLDEGAVAELSTIAKLTPGMSGRDLSNLIDRASRAAVSRFKADRPSETADVALEIERSKSEQKKLDAQRAKDIKARQKLKKKADKKAAKLAKAEEKAKNKTYKTPQQKAVAEAKLAAKREADLQQRLAEMVAGGRGITREDLHSALSAATLGRAATSKVITDHDRTVTSVHEAGHTVAAILAKTLPTPSVVTIIPHGAAGGVTKIPGDDEIFLGQQRALDQLVMAMAGRAAEMICLGEESFTSGASGDIASATQLATSMITEVGMSRLGLAAINADSLRMGGEMAMRVHEEVNVFLNEALQKALDLLKTEKGAALLSVVSQRLQEEETLYADALIDIEQQVDAMIETGRELGRRVPEQAGQQ